METFNTSGQIGQVVGSDGSTGLMWVNGSSVSNTWSEYPATQNVDMATFTLDNMPSLSLSSNLSVGIGETGNVSIQPNQVLASNTNQSFTQVQSGNINISDGFYYNSVANYNGFQSVQGDPTLGTLGVMRANTHNVIISDGEGDDIKSVSLIQPPTFNFGVGLDVYNITTGGRITGRTQNNNGSISCSTLDQSIYSSLDKTSLGFNDGTIIRANINSATPSFPLYDGTNTSVLSTTQLTFNGVPISRSPTSQYTFNFYVDGDTYSMPAVLISGATQFTSASTVNFYSAGDSQYTLTLPFAISNSSVITATYFNQTKNTLYPISVSITSPTQILLEAIFANGLNTFYFSGIIFSA